MLAMTPILALGFVMHGAATTPITPSMKIFGHSVKAGHLPPAGQEVTTFEHACGSAPCAITQLHCPTAGPEGWQLAVVRVYIDGEAVASINVTLLELGNVGRFAPDGQGHGGNGSRPQPWGVGMFGHTAKNGGVYSTMRIPFGSAVRVTIESGMPASGIFWMIVRGVEAYPVVLGDLLLPAAARLRLFRFNGTTKPKQLVTLAAVPKGFAGAVLNVKFDASGTGGTHQLDQPPVGSGSRGGVLDYLEACMRAQFNGEDEVTFLSSGAEDYFLSAWYFNEGEFKTPNSGLTYKGDASVESEAGKISSYKTHDRDPLLFHDGFVLSFRNGEIVEGCGDMGHCPNQFCRNRTQATFTVPDGGSDGVAPNDAAYSILVWIYIWPNTEYGGVSAAETASKREASQMASRLAALGTLFSNGLISEEEHLLARRAALGVPASPKTTG